MPPLTAVLFLMHPIRVWLKPETTLQDPGTGWHLATGRYILETLSIPARDLFSFTAEGREWINHYWLFDVIGAGFVKLGGLPLYATMCMLLYALLPVLLLRRTLQMGAGLAPAFLMTLVAYVVLLSHALARPHAVTYVLFAVLLERLDRYQRGDLSARSLWWIPPMTAVWCNMHGGFLAGLTLIGIFAGVAALRFTVFRDLQERGRALVFTSLLIVTFLATFVNPHGFRLHLSLVEHLRMEAIPYFQEFSAPNFLNGGAAVTMFELLVLLLVLLIARRGRRVSWVECALLVFFLSQALRSVRHMNLFAIVAAPIAARELTPIFDALAPKLQRRLAHIAARQRRVKSDLMYFLGIGVALAVLAIGGVTPFPRNLDGLQLSKGAADYIEAHKERFVRLFNTDNLGGSLIYRFWPDLKVFVDDRIFVYGDDFIMHKYFPVARGEPQWRQVLDEYDVTSAAVATESGCAARFRESSEWQTVFTDDLTTIFLRR